VIILCPADFKALHPTGFCPFGAHVASDTEPCQSPHHSRIHEFISEQGVRQSPRPVDFGGNVY
jgi:hypothetical protein